MAHATERPTTVEDHAALVEHYKAIGCTDIRLWDDAIDRPWAYVTDIVPYEGAPGYVRDSMKLVADHPCGLSFEWYVELRHSVNDDLRWNVPAMLSLRARLPDTVLPAFAEWLRLLWWSLREDAESSQKWADKAHKAVADIEVVIQA